MSDASFTGVSTQYLVRMPWGQELMVFVQNLGTGGVLRPGTQVDLHWNPEHTFALDGSGTSTQASSGSKAHTGRGRLTRGRQIVPPSAPASCRLEEPATDRGSAEDSTRAVGRRRATPYLLLLPGMAWLIVFFVLPMLTLLATSTQTRPPGAEIGVYEQTFRFANYPRRSTSTATVFARSFALRTHRHRRSR